jgi:Na+-driven multidrug efflux pump
MQDVLYAIVFMSLIFGLAAGILFVLDRVTLKKHFTAEEKAIIVAKRAGRWQNCWLCFQACCAVLALIVSIFNPDHERPVVRLL